jgi:hypothetical protein
MDCTDKVDLQGKEYKNVARINLAEYGPVTILVNMLM